MLMSGQNDIHVAIDQYWLEFGSQDARGRAIASRRVDRMMKVGDLPPGTGVSKLLMQPGELPAVQRPAVEDEEAGPTAGESAPQAHLAAAVGVIAFPTHVELLVVNLCGIVMVADRGVEGDAGIEQWLVGSLETLLVVGRCVVIVDIVAQHHDELERESNAPGIQLRGGLVLPLVASSGITDHGESDRAWFSGQGQLPGGRTKFGDGNCRPARDVPRQFTAASGAERRDQRHDRPNLPGARVRHLGSQPNATNCTST